jgi:hypothetical protein
MWELLAGQFISLGVARPVDQRPKRAQRYAQQPPATTQIERLIPGFGRWGPVDEPVETVDSPGLLSSRARCRFVTFVGVRWLGSFQHERRRRRHPNVRR